MALCPPDALSAVLSITTPQRQDLNQIPLGSGFLYNRDRGDGWSDCWIVTNRHVIDDAKGEGSTQLLARVNLDQQRGTQPIVTDLSRWIMHPDSSRDISIHPAPPPEGLQEIGANAKSFGDTNSLDRAMAIQSQLSAGDHCFMLGFPVGAQAAHQDYPVVRFGILSQVQGWFDGHHHTFLVDGSAFPGNSGGPVLLEPTLVAIEGTPRRDLASLIGVVTAQKISFTVCSQCGSPHRESADLVVVEPMDSVYATIDAARSVLPLME
ncbi:MAG: trypsin-like peptidase domain-containing protein [Acidimicrobiaceae bacterium]|nr:trypsin-like peptidase domain-containing protein [Acidimicrobiaceae bacterium]MYH78633.1 trypsin-like peptidase domain-containing protein [Acidimicrobiaceae bacterium]MYK66522.1 trypsin-like peptidase domain-containing protein [Gemmatimonadota bacterium]